MFQKIQLHSSKMSRNFKPGKNAEKRKSKACGDLPAPVAAKTIDVLVTELTSLKTTCSPEQSKIKLPLLAEVGKKSVKNALLAESPLKSILRGPKPQQINVAKKAVFSFRAFLRINEKKSISFSKTDTVILHIDVEQNTEATNDLTETQRITVGAEIVKSKSEQLLALKVDFLESGIEKTPPRERNRAKRVFDADHKTTNPVQ
jgi:hypothetical protein